MYYQGNSEIQADGLQTLYLMNPNNYNTYTDTSQQSGNMFVLNYPAGNGINLESFPNGHQPSPQQQHLVGVPLQTVGNGGGGSDGGGGSIAHLHQSLWRSLDCGNQEIRSRVAVASSSGGGGQPEVSVTQLGYNHLPVVSPTRQGLSLSLSSQQPGFNQVGSNGGGDGNFQASTGGASSSVSVITNGIPGGNNFLLGSKYLKAAQDLLDEVVSIAAKEIKAEIITEKKEEKMKMNKESIIVLEGDQATELTTAQKQEIQMKKSKLISMLDEVEQRYAQYHHQMQVVVTSFEQATRGVGSARSYTQLALKTISKQFRCLKDAISGQIKAASKSLGEDQDILEGKIHGSSSRLKFVDQQIRQQRALQHFGMIQTNNVWRPQRGLPERAVSVLRAWLFEHFLHPYPKDSDKIILAKQTGLTRSQVSNWFINARVRLWKPMVEEMYTEEMKNQETIASESNKQDHSTSTKSASPKDVMNMNMNMTNQEKRKNDPNDLAEISRFGLVSELNPDGISEKNPKRILQADDGLEMQNTVPTISTMISEDMMEVKYGEKESFQTQVIGGNELVIGNGIIGAFSFGDLQNFNPDNFHGGGGGVSLTLGLPPSDHQHNFFSNQNMELRSRLEMGSGGGGGQGNYDQRVHKHHQPPHHLNIGFNDTLHFPNS